MTRYDVTIRSRRQKARVRTNTSREPCAVCLIIIYEKNFGGISDSCLDVSAWRKD